MDAIIGRTRAIAAGAPSRLSRCSPHATDGSQAGSSQAGQHREDYRRRRIKRSTSTTTMRIAMMTIGIPIETASTTHPSSLLADRARDRALPPRQPVTQIYIIVTRIRLCSLLHRSRLRTRLRRDFLVRPRPPLSRMHAFDTIDLAVTIGGPPPRARQADFLFAGRGPGCPDPRSMRLRASAPTPCVRTPPRRGCLLTSPRWGTRWSARGPRSTRHSAGRTGCLAGSMIPTILRSSHLPVAALKPMASDSPRMRSTPTAPSNPALPAIILAGSCSD
jgi:hypothetical protein